MHAVTPGCRRGAQGMVGTAGWRPRRSRLPQLEWRASQRRRIPATRLTTYRDRAWDLSIADAKDGDTAHLAPRGRYGPATPRCGPQCHRSVARPRIDGDDPDLSACRHAA